MANYQLPRFSANLHFTWTHTFKSSITPIEEIFDEDEEQELDNDLKYGKYGIVNANSNTPAFTSNLVLTWQATPHLKLHAHTLFESKQSTHFFDLNKYCYLGKLQDELIIVEEGDPRLEELLDQIIELNEQPYTRKDMSSRAIFNVGADYKIGRLTLGLNIHNLLNTRYDRSGMNTNLVPQQGRWWQISIGYKI